MMLHITTLVNLEKQVLIEMKADTKGHMLHDFFLMRCPEGTERLMTD